MQSNSPAKVQHETILVHNLEGNYSRIDIWLLLSQLSRKLWLVLLLTVLGGCIGWALTTVIKKQYRTTVHLTEPSVNQLQTLYSTTDSTIVQSELFKLFIDKLANEANFNLFVQKEKTLIHSLMPNSTAPMLKSQVNRIRNIGLLKEQQKTAGYSVITNDGMDADLNVFAPKKDDQAKLNQAYLNFTNQQILQDIAAKEKDRVIVKINKLERQLSIQIKTLEYQQDFSIAKLKDTLTTLGKNKHNTQDEIQINHLKDQLINEEYDNNLLTSKQLSNDKTVIEKMLQVQQLKHLSFDTSTIQSFSLQGLPVALQNKPNKKMMIILGVMAGFILALVIVLLQMTFNFRRELAASI